MRLVQVKADGSLSLVKYEGTIPPYAILSHTWGNDGDEITYEDMQNEKERAKVGYAKLTFCAAQAAKDGLQHFWIDTCCIDKSSSAELSEAITSMFRWYKNSDRCYVYLTDVTINKRKADQETPHSTWIAAFRTSRWFTRGWTLQELLAPRKLSFFSREGKDLGTKLDLAQQIHEVTRIPVSALRGDPLHEFSIPERMSWAASRETKREEDEAYSLLGIFGVSMVPNYGEQKEAAFRRLRREIRETTENGTTTLDGEERQLFMDTLRFDQIDARHTTIKNAHAKTCKWLLAKSEYIGWLDATKLAHHHGFLWIKGKPGTGKSTLMKYAFGKAAKTMRRSVVIAFFFNARGDVLEKSVTGMYRSLLLQMLEQVPSLRCTFKSSSLSFSSINAKYQWSINSLEAQLEQAVLGIGDTPVVCFIDALDECEQQQVRSMVSFFENLGELAVSSRKSFQVCFSSRHYPEITIKKGLSFKLEGQEGHTQDIDDYIASELRIGESEVAEQARKELRRKASGVFMWVVLVVDILQKEYNRGRMYALEQRLREIPDDLHQLFYEILTRDSSEKEALILSIQWVLFAKHPLTPGQLYLAILSGVERELLSQWSPGAMPDEDTLRRFILDASKGLTEITKSEPQRVQFIHESIRDFLLKDNGLGRIWPHLAENFEGQSHERLKQCCLTTMGLNVEDHISVPRNLRSCLPQEIVDSRAAVSQAFPILEYAVQNVLHHANAAQGADIDQQNFLESFPLQKWVRLANLFKRRKICRYTSSVSMLYIFGECNMANLIRSYSSDNTCFDVEAERYGPPFFAAVAMESKEAVCAFVDVINKANGRGELCPDAYVHFYQNEHGQSLLPRDFKYSKNKNIVDYLIDLDERATLYFAITTNVIDLNAELRDGSMPLGWASKHGHREVVELLLGTDKIDINATNHLANTALHYAAENGHREVVELLLSNEKIDVNARNGNGATPLYYAAQNGRRDIVALLLSTDKIDVNATNRLAQKPLMMAVRNGHRDIVDLLLSTGKIDVNAKNYRGQTSLILAAQIGHKEIVKMLLRCGKADTNARDNEELTALIISARQGFENIVELLLGHGKTEVNLKDESGRSALSWAAFGPRIVHPDTFGRPTALYLARGFRRSVLIHRAGTSAMLATSNICPNYEAVVKLLLSTNGVDVNSEDDEGCTPLFWAAMNGSGESVELLLNAENIDLEKRDRRGFTALMLAHDDAREKWNTLMLKTPVHKST